MAWLIKKKYRCKICRKLLLSRARLKRHMLLHNRENNTARNTTEIPLDVLNQIDSSYKLPAYNELQNESGSIRTYTCHGCGTGFTTKGSLVRHKKRDSCSYMIKHRKDGGLGDQNEAVSEPTGQDNIESNLQQQNHEPPVFSLKNLAPEFEGEQNQDYSEPLMDNELEPESTSTFVIESVVSTKSDDPYDIANASPPNSVDPYEFSNTTPDSIQSMKKKRTVMADADKPYICNICGTGFLYRANYHRHVKNRSCKHFMSIKSRKTSKLHKPPKVKLQQKFEDKKTKSIEIGNVIPDLVKLLDSRKSDTPVNKVTNKVTKAAEKVSKKPILPVKTENDSQRICCLCREELPTELELKLHIREHLHKVKLPCILCEEEFLSVKERRTHVTKNHAKIVDGLCKLCGEHIVGRESLKNHLFLHPDDRKFECTFCGKIVTKMCYLIYHYNAYHVEKKLQKAKHAEMKRKNPLYRYGLDSLLNLSRKGPKPGPLSSKEQETHIKSFKCSLCRKDFPSKDRLTMHNMKKHHPQESSGLREGMDNDDNEITVFVGLTESAEKEGKGKGKKKKIKPAKAIIQNNQFIDCDTNSPENNQNITNSNEMAAVQNTDDGIDNEDDDNDVFIISGLEGSNTPGRQSQSDSLVFLKEEMESGSDNESESLENSFNTMESFEEYDDPLLRGSNLTCEFCKKVFHTSDSLEEHLLTHEGEEHICEICGEAFSHKSILMKHMTEQHDEENRKYKCSICWVDFMSDTDLAEHMKTIHRDENPETKVFSCDECGMKFKNNSGLGRHKKIHASDRPFPCKVCAVSFLSFSSLIRHQRKFGHMEKKKRPYKRRKPLLGKGKLFNHMQSLEGQSKEQGLIQTENDDSCLLEHSINNDSQNPIDISAKDTIPPIPENLSCTFCDKSFNKKSSLVNHLKLHRSDRPYRCDICDHRFLTVISLNIHLARTHGIKILPPMNVDFQNDNSMGLLDGIYEEETTSLLEHDTSITKLKIEDSTGNETPFGKIDSQTSSVIDYPCTLCDEKFNSFASLTHHMRLHRKYGVFSCNICQEKFASRHIWVTHHKLKHTKPTDSSNEKEKDCNEDDGNKNEIISNESEQKNDSINSNEAEEHKKEVEEYTNDGKNSNEAEEHKNDGSTSNEVEEHKNDGIISNEAEEHKNDGIDNKVEHKDDEMEQCNSSEIKIAEVTGGQGEDFESLADGSMDNVDFESSLMENIDIEDLTCPFCGKVCKQKSSLALHIVVHSPDRPFACNMCDWRFNTNLHLLKHQKEAHNVDVPVEERKGITSGGNNSRVMEYLNTEYMPSEYKDPIVAELLKDADPDCLTCPYCGKVCKQKSSLACHVVVHSPDRPHVCNICNWRFMTEYILFRHQKDKHGIQGSLGSEATQISAGDVSNQDSKVNKSFFLNYLAKKAKKKKKRYHVCTVCNLTFTKYSKYQSHKKVHTVRDHRCHLCYKTFKFRFRLERHIISHSNVRDCPLCGKRNLKGAFYDKHMRMHEMKGEGFKDITTHINNQKRPADLNSDSDNNEVSIPEKKPKLVDDKRPSTFEQEFFNSDYDERSDIYEREEGGNGVDVEREKPSNVNKDKEDVNSDVDNNDDDDDDYKLSNDDDDDYKSSNEDEMNEEDDDDDEEELSKVRVNTFKCHLCNLKFSKHQSYLEHRKIHYEPMGATIDNLKYYYCDICGKDIEGDITMHMASHRTKEGKSYLCKICGKKMINRGNYTMHMKAHMIRGELEPQSDNTCDVCGDVFSSLKALQEHQMKHTQMTTFHCNICGEDFRKSKLYEQHISEHSKDTFVVKDKEFLNGHELESGNNSFTETRTENDNSPNKENENSSSKEVVDNEMKSSENKSEDIVASATEPIDKDNQNKNSSADGEKSLLQGNENTEGIKDSFCTEKNAYVCPICEKSFTRYHKLASHQQIHFEPLIYDCDKCPRTFTSKTEYVKHHKIHTAKTGGKLFECIICHQKVRFIFNYKRHYEGHGCVWNKERENDFAQDQDISKVKKVKGIIVEGKEEFICRYCGKEFLKRSRRIIHEDKHSDKDFDCKYCEKQFIRRKEYLVHLESHGFSQTEEINKLKKESSSNPKFSKINDDDDDDVNDDIEESNSSQEVLKKIENKAVNYNKVDVKLHENRTLGEDGTINRTWTCNYCKRLFNRRSNFIRHCKKHSPIDIKCMYCDCSFFRKRDVREHLAEAHGEERENEDFVGKPLKNISNNSSKETAKFSGKIVDNQHDIEDPLTSWDGGNEDFGRDIVNQTSEQFTLHHSLFSSITDENDDTKTKSTDLKGGKLTCHICNMKFKLKKYLREHLTVHLAEKQFSCHLCSKSFSSSKRLNRHVRTHLNIKPHSCPECGKSFNFKYALKRHMKIHGKVMVNSDDGDLENMRELGDEDEDMGEDFSDDDGSETGNVENEKSMMSSSTNTSNLGDADGKFICPLCGMNCINNKKLQSHLITHSDERPINCPLCTSSFKRNGDLRRHIRKCHAQNPDNVLSKPIPVKDRVAEILTDNLPIKNQDIMAMKNSLTCPLCSNSFKSKWSLNDHVVSHSSDKPFKCPVCCNLFKRFYDMKKHVKTKHNLDADLLVAKEHMFDKLGQRMIHSPYKCDICNKSFIHDSVYKMHMMFHAGQSNLDYSMGDEEELYECAVERNDEEDIDMIEIPSNDVEMPPKPLNTERFDPFATYVEEVGIDIKEEVIDYMDDDEDITIEEFHIDDDDDDIIVGEEIIGGFTLNSTSPSQKHAPSAMEYSPAKQSNTLSSQEDLSTSKYQSSNKYSSQKYPASKEPINYKSSDEDDDDNGDDDADETYVGDSESSDIEERTINRELYDVHPNPEQDTLVQAKLQYQEDTRPALSEEDIKKLVKNHLYCEICNIGFPQSKQLFAHIGRAHLGTVLYMCDICDEKFKFCVDYRTHALTHMSNENQALENDDIDVDKESINTSQDHRSHICAACNKSFRTKRQLNSHMHIHSNFLARVCEGCGKPLFNRNSALDHVTEHLRVFNTADLDDNMSSDIGKGEFTTKDGVSVTHSEGNEGKSDRNINMLEQSKELPTPVKSTRGISVVRKTNDVPKPYQCPYCKKGFKFKLGLKHHIRLHADENIHECNLCKKKFDESSLLMKHLEDHFERDNCIINTANEILDTAKAAENVKGGADITIESTVDGETESTKSEMDDINDETNIVVNTVSKSENENKDTSVNENKDTSDLLINSAIAAVTDCNIDTAVESAINTETEYDSITESTNNAVIESVMGNTSEITSETLPESTLGTKTENANDNVPDTSINSVTEKGVNNTVIENVIKNATKIASEPLIESTLGAVTKSANDTDTDIPIDSVKEGSNNTIIERLIDNAREIVSEPLTKSNLGAGTESAKDTVTDIPIDKVTDRIDPVIGGDFNTSKGRISENVKETCNKNISMNLESADEICSDFVNESIFDGIKVPNIESAGKLS